MCSALTADTEEGNEAAETERSFPLLHPMGTSGFLPSTLPVASGSLPSRVPTPIPY